MPVAMTTGQVPMPTSKKMVSNITFRRANRTDLPAIVALLADDPLGHKRENDVLPLTCPHWPYQ